MNDGKEVLEQIDAHLASANVMWLFGAGASVDANLPLMGSLTRRVKELLRQAGGPPFGTYEALAGELGAQHHIEHVLSHLADYTALAERCSSGAVTLGDREVRVADLRALHQAIVSQIGEVVRWGFVEALDGAEARIGGSGKAITEIDQHREFMKVLFRKARAGHEGRRGPVRFFTVNYDTLLEDALALESVRFWDGFSGGAIAFRSFRVGDSEPEDRLYDAHVIKLHGSIDWRLSADEKRVYRVRDGDAYPSREGRVLIYPESTKYRATQRDPFAGQFELLRRALAAQSQKALVVCGYSFGDDHINDEIETGLARSANSTLIACSFDGEEGLPATLEKWRSQAWAEHVYVLSPRGIYRGAQGPFHPPDAGASREWWKFSGISKVVRQGAESCL